MRNVILILLGLAGAALLAVGLVLGEAWLVAAGVFQVAITAGSWALWGVLSKEWDGIEDRPISDPMQFVKRDDRGLSSLRSVAGGSDRRSMRESQPVVKSRAPHQPPSRRSPPYKAQ